MKKTVYCLFFGLLVRSVVCAQCKPIDLATFKNYVTAANITKEALFTKAGFKKSIDVYDAEAGLAHNYTACWVVYKDGYARFAQQIIWYPEYRLISVNMLDKTNFDNVKAAIVKTAKYNGMEADKTESYQDESFFYSFQIVDDKEPLQKKHPAYVIAIALRK